MNDQTAAVAQMSDLLDAAAPTRAEEINRLHGEIGAALPMLRMTVEKALRIGELLTEQKAELAHGEWLPWVEGNLPFSEDTAQRYMRLHREQPSLENRNVRYLSDAYRAIGVLAPPAPAEPAEPVTTLVTIRAVRDLLAKAVALQEEELKDGRYRGSDHFLTVAGQLADEGRALMDGELKDPTLTLVTARNLEYWAAIKRVAEEAEQHGRSYALEAECRLGQLLSQGARP